VTFPASAQDGPAGLGVEGDRYPGIEGRVVYGEGTLVGYRFYETTRLAPLFPFGFGLSYGDMALEDVRTDVVDGGGGGAGDGGDGDGGGEVVVQVTVVNNGARQGTEVVQVYVRAPESLVRRPDRELVAFAKVTVDAGGSETVRLPLDAAAFRYWDVDAHAWRADPGRYELLVGKSSQAIWASTEIMWGGTSAS
jgi:beta-glucosidase